MGRPRSRLSPTTRYRYGAHTRATRAAHAQQARNWRREVADAAFDKPTRVRFLAAVRRAGSVAAVADKFGVSHQQVYGRASWDPEFAAQLDTALSVNCIGGHVCGKPGGYRRGGRCPACRTAHRHRLVPG